MKHLILVRHAQAEPAGNDEQDINRALTRRGTQEATEMARRLKRADRTPDTIVTSAARRAYTTAALFANTLQLGSTALITDERIYAAGVTELFDVIRGAPSCNRLLLVAHNPTISELADRLANVNRVPTLPTCGVVLLNFEVDSWGDLNWKTGRDVMIDSPDRQ